MHRFQLSRRSRNHPQIMIRYRLEIRIPKDLQLR